MDSQTRCDPHTVYLLLNYNKERCFGKYEKTKLFVPSDLLVRGRNPDTNVARLNFSHGTHEEHLAKNKLIKKVREKLKLPIAIMLDTKGPEYRIKTFKNK